MKMALILRRMLAVFLSAIGAAWGFLCFLLNDPGSIRQSIEHHRMTETAFREESQFIDAYAKEHGTLPSPETKRPHQADPARSVYYPSPELMLTPPYDRHTPLIDGSKDRRIGALLEGTDAEPYVLVRWNGDDFDYYLPRSGRTTLDFNEDDYYPFHSRAMVFVIALFGLLPMAIGVWLWKKRPSLPMDS